MLLNIWKKPFTIFEQTNSNPQQADTDSENVRDYNCQSYTKCDSQPAIIRETPPFYTNL